MGFGRRFWGSSIPFGVKGVGLGEVAHGGGRECLWVYVRGQGSGEWAAVAS